MGWTKRTLIKRAFGQIGLSSSEFDVSAEQLQEALELLDAMMAEWNSHGIRVGYALPTDSDGSSLDEESGVIDSAYAAVYRNLAIDLAATVGRPVPATLETKARAGKNVLMAQAAIPDAMRMPRTMPSGAGQKPHRGPTRPFIDDEDNSIATGSDSKLDLLFDADPDVSDP